VKKVLLLVALAAALTGCAMTEDFDVSATRVQAEEECQRFNGVRTVMTLDYYVSSKPWTVTCVNTSTGNSFKVYVPGIRK